MKVAIGCDHGGLNLKSSVKELLNALGHEVEDFGCHTADSCDYPDIAVLVLVSVLQQIRLQVFALLFVMIHSLLMHVVNIMTLIFSLWGNALLVLA